MKIRVMEHPPETNTDHIEKLFSTVTEVKKKEKEHCLCICNNAL